MNFPEAKYYERLDNNKVRCFLCPHNCIIREGKYGICKTKLNKDGILYSVAYSNPCAVHIDPIEKKPLYHFLPSTPVFSIATAGCNLSCKNCQNWQISQVSPLELNFYELSPIDVVARSLENKCHSIAYTYTDPVAFYEYTLDTAKEAKKKGVKNILISAGYINPKPLEELLPFIDAANIDLKSFDDKIYRRLNAGKLEPVLNTLKILKQNNVWVEITNLIIPGWTDDLKMIEKMCHWLVDNGFADNPIHFSRFMPVYKLQNTVPTPEAILEQAAEIASKAGLKFVYLGNVPGHTAENTYCPSCGNLLIERTGYSIGKINIDKLGKCKFCGENIPGIWK